MMTKLVSMSAGAPRRTHDFFKAREQKSKMPSINCVCNTDILRVRIVASRRYSQSRFTFVVAYGIVVDESVVAHGRDTYSRSQLWPSCSFLL